MGIHMQVIIALLLGIKRNGHIFIGLLLGIFVGIFFPQHLHQPRFRFAHGGLVRVDVKPADARRARLRLNRGAELPAQDERVQPIL